jgi:hypothetical protein
LSLSASYINNFLTRNSPLRGSYQREINKERGIQNSKFKIQNYWADARELTLEIEHFGEIGSLESLGNLAPTQQNAFLKLPKFLKFPNFPKFPILDFYPRISPIILNFNFPFIPLQMPLRPDGERGGKTIHKTQ